MSSIKNSIVERARHQRQYDRRVNEIQMERQEGEDDRGKALDADLVVTESSRTESKNHDTNSRSERDTHAKDANIKPVNYKVPMAKVQMTAEYNVLANGQQHAEQPEFNTEGRVDQDAKQYQVKSPLLDADFFKTKDMTVENADLKALIQKKVFANAALKNELRKLKGNSMDTKFVKPSILGKPVLQPLKNQLIVRQPSSFQFERPNFSKPRFAFQVDIKHNLPKPVTPHYLPKVKEFVLTKPHHVIAPGSSRNNQEELYGSNDMAHNYFIDEARKKTQDRNRNLKHIEMHSARKHHTLNACTPKLRSNNQMSRNWLASKSSVVTLNAVQFADHSSNPISFSDSKHFVCSTCQKCIFNANHDACLTKFLNESLVIHQGVEEQIQGIQNSQFNNEPFLYNLTPNPSSEESSSQRVIPSNLHQLNQSFDYLSKWSKDHPLENVIGNPS
ncbi:hypothetical protein Tco_0912714 [Tanacetum coccineum]